MALENCCCLARVLAAGEPRRHRRKILPSSDLTAARGGCRGCRQTGSAIAAVSLGSDDGVSHKCCCDCCVVPFISELVSELICGVESVSAIEKNKRSWNFGCWFRVEEKDFPVARLVYVFDVSR
ncbi:uncharacterized protein DS421_3g85150 [Arachis hypogaea]|nr:uncharacterized protein DS421_3g85150 [Arachis hypogaea]